MVPSPTKKRASRMSASARREQLLDVTTKLIARRGFHDLSIEAVASKAGVTRATVYQHFADLRQLLQEVVERETTRALAQVTETSLEDLTHGDPVELMLESLNAFLYAVRDNPDTWRLVFMPPEGAPKVLHRRIAQGRASVLAEMARAVRPALRIDEDAPDAELTARILQAISDEYARLVLTDPKRFPPARLLDHARWLLQQFSIQAPSERTSQPTTQERD
jgi:AcrR family transcriptional regulator